MKILVAHNRYRHPGGEDHVVAGEIALLRANGHEVIEYLRDNAELDAMGPLARVGAAVAMSWSWRTQQDVRALLQRHRPRLVHVHNSFLRMSPSLHWAVADAGLPLVQTLHNFRLGCAQGSLLRDGQPCERCLGHSPWPAVRHACWRGSHLETAALAGMLMLHRRIGTWRDKVTRYIALNRFCRDKLVQAGLPAERIRLHGNFVDDLPPPGLSAPRQGLLYVGRLTEEKGVGVLAAALRLLADLPQLTLDVMGEGPAEALLRAVPKAGPQVRLHGQRAPHEVREAMRQATLLLVPSLAQEAMPRVVVEAFAEGLPVLASQVGGLPELVSDGQTGRLVPPGDAAALAAALRGLVTQPGRLRAMGIHARLRYTAEFTPAIAYRRLMGIYDEALA